MNLFVNMVLEEVEWDGEKKEYYRILWIESNYKTLVWMNLSNEKAMPQYEQVKFVLEQIDEGILIVTKEDPYTCIHTEDNLTEEQKNKLEENWIIISSLVTQDSQLDIFNPKERGKLVQGLVEKGYTKPTIYKWLKKYWRYGQQKMALFPDYQKRGGKGKDKKMGDKKMGVPRKAKEIFGEGKNITEEMKEKIRKEYVKHYVNDKKASLKQAYYNFLYENFSRKQIINGIEHIVLNQHVFFPSFDQFKYWGKKLTDNNNVKRKRIGEWQYNLTQREILATSNAYVFGPGSVFQIDSTPADIYLVSSINPNIIIRRPHLYFVVDVFSRLIVGFHVDTRPASLAAAKLALYCTGANKMDYCKKIGVEIGEEEWPSEHMPFSLVADRGELRSKAVEALEGFLNIHVANTPAYRPELKGIVERALGMVQQKAKALIPGYVDKDFGIRGSDDYRLDAVLNIEDFRKYIIEFIRKHNQSVLQTYELSKEMIRDNVLPIPINLWRWGITHQSGLLHKVQINQLKYSCMTLDKAKVTGKGVIFKKMKYFSKEFQDKGWFAFSRGKVKTIDIVYDARDMTYIYYRDSETKDVVVLKMDESSKYYGKALMEIEAIQEYEFSLKKQAFYSDLEKELTFTHRIKKITNEAEIRQKKVIELTPESNNKRIKNINVNNQEENYTRLPKEAMYFDEVIEQEETIAEVDCDLLSEEEEIQEYDEKQLSIFYKNMEEKRHEKK
ncbi:transposase [Bacillus cereus group sp. Bc222]|uniref:transposase family protein n=1 Tax=unclassified Bacillus cereus group TaxID=2750818 RepID=UPI000A3F7ACE|nr:MULTISPECIES: transposase family protein [unclassified Bacillus cereus group]MDA2239535.1 transposase [Bacillus cereus group sp. Bc222]MDA2586331.1 transposase [Bacillus cereus group sp. Bc062]